MKLNEGSYEIIMPLKSAAKLLSSWFKSKTDHIFPSVHAEAFRPQILPYPEIKLGLLMLSNSLYEITSKYKL